MPEAGAIHSINGATPLVFYLAAIMGWHSRRILAWRRSNTLEAEFCVEALDAATERFGPPEITNTDRGSQFTAFAWTDRLRRSGIRISMDGAGRFFDDIFIERLWRPLTYECVHLHAWETGRPVPAREPGSTSTATGSPTPPSTDSRRTWSTWPAP